MNRNTLASNLTESPPGTPVQVLMDGEVLDIVDVEYEPESSTIWLKTERV